MWFCAAGLHCCSICTVRHWQVDILHALLYYWLAQFIHHVVFLTHTCYTPFCIPERALHTSCLISNLCTLYTMLYSRSMHYICPCCNLDLHFLYAMWYFLLSQSIRHFGLLNGILFTPCCIPDSKSPYFMLYFWPMHGTQLAVSLTCVFYMPCCILN